MTNYSPTVTPGDERRRTRYLGIRIPHNGVPTVEVLEQDVIRTKAGIEEIIRDLGGFNRTVDAAALAESFPVRNPADDSLTGGSVTTAQTMALIYSWVRAQQLLRDAAAAQTTPTEE